MRLDEKQAKGRIVVLFTKGGRRLFAERQNLAAEAVAYACRKSRVEVSSIDVKPAEVRIVLRLPRWMKRQTLITRIKTHTTIFLTKQAPDTRHESGGVWAKKTLAVVVE